MAQQQQLLFHLHQQQLFLMQQQQLQLQQQQLQPQQQQQSQPSTRHQSPYNLLQQKQAISRFPSNIDAHLRAPGLRSLHFQAPTPPAAAQPSSSQPLPSSVLRHPPQPQSARPAAGLGGPGTPWRSRWRRRTPCWSATPTSNAPSPPWRMPCSEAEEDDRILDGDTTGHIISRLQQWDHNILTKIAEFTTTFEKQVLAFNILSQKRAQGEFRSEERLMIGQALMREVKQALLEIKAEMESREKADREAAEAKMWMAKAQAEHARAVAQVRAEMYARAPMTDEEPSEDFLNDENETENVDTRAQGEWREAGELDLNSRVGIHRVHIAAAVFFASSATATAGIPIVSPAVHLQACRRHPEGPVPCVPELDRDRARDALPVVDQVAGALAPEQLGVDRGGAGEAFRPQEHVGDGAAAQVLHLHLEHRVVADLPPRVGLLHLNARQIAPLARHCQRSQHRGQEQGSPMGPQTSSTSRWEEGLRRARTCRQEMEEECSGEELEESRHWICFVTIGWGGFYRSVYRRRSFSFDC
ncbi:hypothetical protein MUK42_22742 [Musa troglodytarum]|uniref:GLTSCR protein conserved domain-containing protein n=1 Tax=Musa troglodytarum TaxID=320322 RepID=A0A9E7L473_9LILI|nr:hypothetical protein MUK42_22742 [Musa troglodytarum]